MESTFDPRNQFWSQAIQFWSQAAQFWGGQLSDRNGGLPTGECYKMYFKAKHQMIQTLLHGFLGLRTSVREMKLHPKVPSRSNQRWRFGLDFLLLEVFHSHPWKPWMPQMEAVETFGPWLSWSQLWHYCQPCGDHCWLLWWKWYIRFKRIELNDYFNAGYCCQSTKSKEDLDINKGTIISIAFKK